jgi:excisionase family DNA binding protein
MPAEERDMGDPQLLRDVLADDALLVTPEEAAQLLRVGRTTVYALMKTGDLRPVHIGRSCRLPRGELQRYVDGRLPRGQHGRERAGRSRPQPVGRVLACALLELVAAQ